MTGLYIIVGILLFLTVFLLLILFTTTEIGISYLLKDNVKKTFLHLKLFKIISIKIPIKDKKDKKTKKKKRNHKEKEKEKKEFSIEDFLKITKQIKEAYTETKGELSEIAQDIRKDISFKEVTFEVLFATGNAAKTGITNGAVWTSATLLTKILDEIFSVENINLNVIPRFEGKCFNMYVKSIINLKLINILIILKKVVKIINIFKNKISTNKEKAVL